MSQARRQEKKQREEIRQAMQELDAIRCELDAAYRSFDAVTDPDALGACIFEIGALRARYSLALRQLRAKLL